jgi:hypothetical protein
MFYRVGQPARQLATSSFGLVNDLNERMIFGLPASEAIRK